MIYLCSVYSLNYDGLGEEEHLGRMDARCEFAQAFAAEMLKEGYCIFSPIAHCHPIAEKFEMPREWDFWEKLDYQYIDACDEVWVLMMPHWMESRGISAELDYAEKTGKPITYIPCEGLEEGF